MSFREQCLAAAKRARAARNKGDDAHIEAVIRVNGSEDWVFQTRNESYDTSNPTQPDFGPTGQARAKIKPLAPFNPPLEFSDEVYSLTRTRREYQAWKSRETIINHSDFEHEVLMKIMSVSKEYKLVGLNPWDSADRFREEIRKEKLKQLGFAPQVDSEADRQELAQLTKLKLQHQDEELVRYSPWDVDYPSSCIKLSPTPYGKGGHAEEILIREWSSMFARLASIKHIDLFITRMPCPFSSSAFEMSWEGSKYVFKQGCMNKVNQLVGLLGPDVTWTITYMEALNPELQTLADRFAQNLPKNARLTRVSIEDVALDVSVGRTVGESNMRIFESIGNDEL